MNKIKYILLSSILLMFFTFGFKNVKADVYIENEAYIIDFNNNNYNESDFYSLGDLGNQLIDFFEVEYGTEKIITNTNFVDTNLNNLEFIIMNDYYDEIEMVTVLGFSFKGYTDNDELFKFDAFLLGDVPFLYHIDIGDYYVNFDFLLPPPERFISHFTKIFDFLITPFTDILERLGIENTPISVGFGEIEWFNIALYDLTYLTLSFTVLYLFFRLIYKLIKVFVRIITGGIL